MKNDNKVNYINEEEFSSESNKNEFYADHVDNFNNQDEFDHFSTRENQNLDEFQDDESPHTSATTKVKLKATGNASTLDEKEHKSKGHKFKLTLLSYFIPFAFSFLVLVAWPLGKYFAILNNSNIENWKYPFSPYAIAIIIAVSVTLFLLLRLFEQTLILQKQIKIYSKFIQKLTRVSGPNLQGEVVEISKTIQNEINDLDQVFDYSINKYKNIENIIKKQQHIINDLSSKTYDDAFSAADRIATETNNLKSLSQLLNSQAEAFSVAISQSAKTGLSAMAQTNNNISDLQSITESRISKMEGWVNDIDNKLSSIAESISIKTSEIDNYATTAQESLDKSFSSLENKLDDLSLKSNDIDETYKLYNSYQDKLNDSVNTLNNQVETSKQIAEDIAKNEYVNDLKNLLVQTKNEIANTKHNIDDFKDIQVEQEQKIEEHQIDNNYNKKENKNQSNKKEPSQTVQKDKKASKIKAQKNKKASSTKNNKKEKSIQIQKEAYKQISNNITEPETLELFNNKSKNTNDDINIFQDDVTTKDHPDKSEKASGNYKPSSNLKPKLKENWADDLSWEQILSHTENTQIKNDNLSQEDPDNNFPIQESFIMDLSSQLGIPRGEKNSPNESKAIHKIIYESQLMTRRIAAYLLEGDIEELDNEFSYGSGDCYALKILEYCSDNDEKIVTEIINNDEALKQIAGNFLTVFDKLLDQARFTEDDNFLDNFLQTTLGELYILIGLSSNHF